VEGVSKSPRTIILEIVRESEVPAVETRRAEIWRREIIVGSISSGRRISAIVLYYFSY
jgi:hypothetical protein